MDDAIHAILHLVTDPVVRQWAQSVTYMFMRLHIPTLKWEERSFSSVLQEHGKPARLVFEWHGTSVTWYQNENPVFACVVTAGLFIYARHWSDLVGVLNSQ